MKESTVATQKKRKIISGAIIAFTLIQGPIFADESTVAERNCDDQTCQCCLATNDPNKIFYHPGVKAPALCLSKNNPERCDNWCIYSGKNLKSSGSWKACPPVNQTPKVSQN